MIKSQDEPHKRCFVACAKSIIDSGMCSCHNAIKLNESKKQDNNDT